MVEGLIREIEKRTNIQVYERSIMNVLGAVLSSDDFWEIVDLSEEPLPLVAHTIDVLRKKDYIRIEEGISLTEKGRKLAEDLGVSPIKKLYCRRCLGRGLDLDEFGKILREFRKVTRDRPLPKQEFDQAFVTDETIIARLAFMVSRNDVDNKEILVIGDDDLTSVALMLYGSPKRIAVVDIDKRLTGFIERVSRDVGYDRIEVLTLDIRNDLPNDLEKSFDTFITDPPETEYAIRAFVGRGISSLKRPGCAGYLGLTRRESSIDKWMRIERLLVNEFGVAITDIVRDFNEYVNWGYEEKTRAWRLTPIKRKPTYNWYKSYMLRIVTLQNSKGFDGKIDVNEELYNDEESSTT